MYWTYQIDGQYVVKVWLNWWKTESIQQKITCKFVGPVVCNFFMGRCVHMTYRWLYCLPFVMNVHSCMYLCSMGSPITWVQFLWVLLYLQTSYLTIITRTLHFTRTTNMEVFFALQVCCFLILDKSASAVSKAKS